LTAIISLISFIETPLGQALISVVPTLVEDVISIWHKNGVITSQDITDYIASQKSFESLVPRRG
jgi:hypothetical protein